MAESKRSSYQPEKEKAAPIIRKNYLFVIGIDEYQHLRPLQNAVTDAKSVAKMLTDHFDCEIPNFAQPLLNKDATRTSLTRQFKALSQHFKKQAFRDNLLIYFAGHGEWDDDFEAGYWALHSAREGDLSTYFSNADLVQAIKAIRSHHTLIISDSCFSGGLIETARRRSNRKESNRSRYVLASGLKDETVSDGAPGTQSPFAASIVDFLEIQKGKSFNIRQLEIHIEAHFKQNKLKQEPIFAPLSIPENKDGELWLYPRFDEVTELDRLIEAGDVNQVDGFIERHDEALSKRRKLKYAREKLENLAWEQAKEARDGIMYLSYLDRFMQVRNDHPEQALAALRTWIQFQKEEWEEAEENVAHWEGRYERIKKQLTQLKEQLISREKDTQQIEELSEKLKEADSKRVELETKLQRSIKTHQNAQNAQAKLSDERNYWKQEAEVKETELEKLRLAKVEPVPEIPTFDFPVPEMIRIEGGTFRMGAAFDATLDSFEIGKYPLTQREWQAIMGKNPSHFTGEDLPVEKISWKDCQQYIDKLNEKTGLNFRFPTEAEWEYAAGGGSGNRTEWAGTHQEDQLADYAWYDANSGKKTHPVGQKKPNSLDLHDMSGNVWEWCADWYADYPSGARTNYTGPSTGSNRVIRGGSWNDDASDCRVASRYGYTPGDRSLNVGIRLARSV